MHTKTLTLPSGMIFPLGNGFETDEEAIRQGRSIAYRRGRFFAIYSLIPSGSAAGACPYPWYSQEFYDWMIGHAEV